MCAGQRAKSTAQIIDSLQAAEVPINSRTQAFAEKLLQKVAGSASTQDSRLSEMKRKELEKVCNDVNSSC